MKSYLTMVSVSALLLLAGCGSKEEKGGKPEPRVPAGEALAELLTAVKPNPNFRPEIGNYGGRLVLSTIADPKAFNPITAMETSTTAITGHIFEGLTTTDGVTTQVKPRLAEKWEVSEDGRTWTFYLRKGVVWNDGEPFTAEDVLFTFQLIYDESVPTSMRDILTIAGKRIEVEKVDEHTVRFILPFKYAPFARVLSMEIVPKHILEKPWKEGKFTSTWNVDTPPEEIVGTGPFMLESYIPQERVLLKRNPRYWKRDVNGNRLPYLNEIVYIVVQSQDVQLLKFKNGELDNLFVRGQDVRDLYLLQQNLNFTLYKLGPQFGESFIFFNQNPGKNPKTGKPYVEPHKLKWFRNVKFRQAIAHAIDRQSMIEIVLDGFGYPQWGPMSPKAGFFYNPDVKKYPYNLEKARQLLREEGFIDRDGDGFLEDLEGNPVEFRLYTNSGNKIRERIGAMIVQDLEKLGIKTYFRTLEFNYLVSIIDNTYDFDCVLLGLTGGIEPHFGANVWLSSGHLHMWYPKQKEPSTGWERRIDEIFEQGVQELDPRKRKELYDEWQVIVSENLPLIYTVLQETIVALRNRFGNLNPAPYGGVLHNLEEIYVKSPR